MNQQTLYLPQRRFTADAARINADQAVFLEARKLERSRKASRSVLSFRAETACSTSSRTLLLLRKMANP